MAILVTRPHPDAETTAATLLARGFEVLLAPMLRFEPAAFHDDTEARYGAVIVTSANALRAIEADLKASRLLKLPLFAVGEHSATVARDLGFTQVISAGGEATALRDCVLGAVKSKVVKKAHPLLYLAGADLLHYSRRSAGAFLEAVRAAGIEISALSVPQFCISAGVASVLREAGATGVMAAASPDENALFALLDRALRR